MAATSGGRVYISGGMTHPHLREDDEVKTRVTFLGTTACNKTENVSREFQAGCGSEVCVLLSVEEKQQQMEARVN